MEEVVPFSIRKVVPRRLVWFAPGEAGPCKYKRMYPNPSDN